MEDSLTWTAIGDSFTVGTGDETESGGWVARTVQNLARAGTDVALSNFAVKGAPIVDVLSRQAAQMSERSSIVSAIAGANDLLKLRVSNEVLERGVHDLIELATRRGDIVLTATCPDFFHQRYGLKSRLSPRVNVLNDMLRDAVAAREESVIVLDTHEMFRDRSLWSDDLVHPNAGGHAMLAEAATSLIEAKLKLPQMAGV